MLKRLMVLKSFIFLVFLVIELHILLLGLSFIRFSVSRV